MFGGDPFGDPFSNMRRHMRDMDRMMESMMEPFGLMDHPFLSNNGRARNYGNMLEDGQPRGNTRNRRSQDDMGLSPFGGLFGGGLFGGISNLMNQMEDLQHRAINDPNAHVFTQSTMISFDGNNGPRVVQESLRKAGDVKETRRSVQNGFEGDAEMEVGHHMGDRAHIIEKKRDADGRVRQQQRFVNLDENEAETFNSEFKTRAQRNLGNLFGEGAYNAQHAIEDTGHSRENRPRSSRSRGTHETGRATSYTDHTIGSGGSNAPIVTIPEDDDEGNTGRHGRHQGRGSRNNGYYYPSQSGPTIREISEEEADMSIPKRRKGGR